MKRRLERARGFTLLEAIVAMVLLSGAGLAVFGWINANLSSLSRVHEANRRSNATVNALEFMRTVNPMLDPNGQTKLAEYEIRWESRPLTDTVDRLASNYQFALFRTRIAVSRPDEPQWFELELRQVGHKKVRSSADPQ